MKKILILRHIAIEGPGTLGEFLNKGKIAHEILDVFKDEGAILPKIERADIGGVVILGGPMNVYEEEKYPFLTAEKGFIRELVKKKVPLLGICLGAQLIACVLEAKVRRAPVKEIGWYDVHLEKAAKDDPLLENFGDEIKVFQWHEDAFDLPINAVLLATSNGINQAFRFQKNIWGFQFHLEVDGEMIHSWYRDYITEEKSEDSWKEIKKTYLDIKGNFDRQARAIYASFLNLAQAEP